MPQSKKKRNRRVHTSCTVSKDANLEDWMLEEECHHGIAIQKNIDDTTMYSYRQYSIEPQDCIQ